MFSAAESVKIREKLRKIWKIAFLKRGSRIFRNFMKIAEHLFKINISWIFSRFCRLGIEKIQKFHGKTTGGSSKVREVGWSKSQFHSVGEVVFELPLVIPFFRLFRFLNSAAEVVLNLHSFKNAIYI